MRTKLLKPRLFFKILFSLVEPKSKLFLID